MKKTKLNKAHHLLNGKMIDFFGWELPVQYSGISAEHNAVRNKGGLFDVSHMGEIFIRGVDALEAVQFITSNNAAKLVPGKIQYSAFPTPSGCFIDDLLVYMVSKNEYLLVVNAANLDKDFDWVKGNTSQFNINLKNESDNYSQIAIQGPLSEKLLSGFTGTDLSSIGYYHFTTGKVNGIDSIISRTGYTGEDGFEIYFIANEEKSSDLFIQLAEKGSDMGIIPAGLGARDTLRLESKMTLYGNDIDDSHTILEADLGWILRLKKGEFIGKSALQKQKGEGIKRKLIGFELVDKGIARHGYDVFIDSEKFSIVTSGTFAPFLKKSIGLTYLPVEKCSIGTIFHVDVRGKMLKCKVVDTPFYKRTK